MRIATIVSASWLNPTLQELAEIAQRTGWDVERVIHYEDEPEAYAAILRHSA